MYVYNGGSADIGKGIEIIHNGLHCLDVEDILEFEFSDVSFGQEDCVEFCTNSSFAFAECLGRFGFACHGAIDFVCESGQFIPSRQ